LAYDRDLCLLYRSCYLKQNKDSACAICTPILGKKLGGKKLKNLMWRAAVSTYPQAWEREMRNIKEVNLETYKYLIAIPPRFFLSFILTILLYIMMMLTFV